jgi:hypothetical protein
MQSILKLGGEIQAGKTTISKKEKRAGIFIVKGLFPPLPA